MENRTLAFSLFIFLCASTGVVRSADMPRGSVRALAFEDVDWCSSLPFPGINTPGLRIEITGYHNYTIRFFKDDYPERVWCNVYQDVEENTCVGLGDNCNGRYDTVKLSVGYAEFYDRHYLRFNHSNDRPIRLSVFYLQGCPAHNPTCDPYMSTSLLLKATRRNAPLETRSKVAQ